LRDANAGHIFRSNHGQRVTNVLNYWLPERCFGLSI
jgi:hypothetical protein